VLIDVALRQVPVLFLNRGLLTVLLELSTSIDVGVVIEMLVVNHGLLIKSLLVALLLALMIFIKAVENKVYFLGICIHLLFGSRCNSLNTLTNCQPCLYQG
jgi:hypothetical protein